MLPNCCKQDEDNTVIDIDGNIYQTITLGTQIWMAENLKTIKYNDDTPISMVTDNTSWSNLTSPAYCYYDNDETMYKNTYGVLYNWYAVNTGKLCPIGWHVPTVADWDLMIEYLGGEDVAGGKLKEAGLAHWADPNTGATNETGFTALPGGFRNYDGTFYDVGDLGYCWSATENDATSAWYSYLHYYDSSVGKTNGSKKYGFSVRCIKD